jgi:hypothetical protein
MATQIQINKVRSIQLSDVYPSDNAQRQAGAEECVRTLRIFSEEGELRITLSARQADSIMLSYQKR